MYYETTHETPLGMVTLACDDKSLVGLWNAGQTYFGKGVPEKRLRTDDMPILLHAKDWLDRYFAGERPAISELPVQPLGSAFRQAVWKILCDIPYGTVITYGDIAKQMAAKLHRETMSGQAVGGAVGHNPISIIIPCHRVVGAGGNLTGYASGIAAKMKLLKLEGMDLSRFFIPKHAQ